MTNTEVIVHSVYSLSLSLFLSQLAVLHYALAFFYHKISIVNAYP